jgi:hypothetical protein
MKKNTFYYILLICLNFNLISAFGQSKIKGVVYDSDKTPLPYASIFIKNTSNGTLSNEQGLFELISNGPQAKTLVVQSVGYKTNNYDLSNGINDIVIILEKEVINIEEVNIVAGEDPAIPIVRATIKNKKKILESRAPYQCELYMKGLIKLVDAPKKFMGQDLKDMDGLLDSNRQGIVYLSETFSNIYFNPPSQIREELLSSKVSGSSNAISANQFSFSNFNFYGENIGLTRDVISPLANDALLFYNYYLYEEVVNDGYTIAKIKVKPKNNFRPCFTGFIYINKDLNQLQSLDLKVFKDQLKGGIMDSIYINQVFVETEKNNWQLLSQNLDFAFNIFSFNTKGGFRYIFKNYKTEEKSSLLKYPKNEIFSAKSATIKNDTAFWNEHRPIPLLADEINDYVKKEKLELRTNSPAFKDSVEAANNKFLVRDLLFGYSGAAYRKNLSYSISSVLNNVQFNPVEGLNLGFKTRVAKRDTTDEYNKVLFNGIVRYGFLDKKIKTEGNIRFMLDNIRRTSFSISGGRNYTQYSEKGIISDFGNTYRSLYYKDNQARLLQKDFIKFDIISEVVNSFVAQVNVEYAQRNNLVNNTQYSLRKKDVNYSNNNPFNTADANYKLDDHLLKITLGMRFIPGQKFKSYPNYRVRYRSKWPQFSTALTYVPRLDARSANYTKLTFNIYENEMTLKRAGYLTYQAQVGQFLNSTKVSDVDLFHQGEFTGFASQYLNGFKQTKPYQLSSALPFAAAFAEYHPSGLINELLPGMKKLNITGIYSYSIFKNKEHTYMEPGVGIEGLKYKIFDLGRIDYFWGIVDGKLQNHGIRVGFSVFFENLVGN